MNLDHLVELEYGWGHLPPTDIIFNAFDKCNNDWRPTNILEIGFHLGHSTTYLLEIFEQAKVTTVSPAYEFHQNHVLERQRAKIKGEIPEDLDKHTAETRREMALVMKEKYGDRFNWIPTQTSDAFDALEKYGPFDFALIDGQHSYENTTVDLNCCALFGIKHLLIDNIDQHPVLSAVNHSQWNMINMFPYVSDDENINVMGLLIL